MGRNELCSIFDRLGWKYIELYNEDGGSILILERGCRVIGVYPDSNAENAVWVRPELAELANSAAVTGMKESWNIGGDRTFISPEVEYFYNPSTAAYLIPAALDPGSYETGNRVHGSLTANQTVNLQAYRSDCEIGFDMSKRIRLVPDPLKLNEAEYGLEYSFVGYEVEAEIVRHDHLFLGDETKQLPPLSLWNLIQVPAAGEAILPTNGPAKTVSFLAGYTPCGLQEEPDHIRFQIDARVKSKISIRAGETTGKIGYIRTTADGRSLLLIRSFRVDPTKLYGDVPLDRQDDFGHCVQCYNDDGAFGYFGEIEYHTPLMESTDRVLTDVSQVWCYVGDREQIGKVADVLLQARI
ncbi:DUF6786 family protein [Paenibacillus mendelii]|uniref:DUF6786 family protein n=1 Tax=Paenibacillus mendelii TaxID=206163 RepID=A0ABV6J7C3_9BACL|nr:DUF6786 family protein [Paenibacillus mendelii]MCQ6562122.1 hypothetical protein [Paenibacillus mendelii]